MAILLAMKPTVKARCHENVCQRDSGVCHMDDCLSHPATTICREGVGLLFLQQQSFPTSSAFRPGKACSNHQPWSNKKARFSNLEKGLFKTTGPGATTHDSVSVRTRLLK